MKRLLAACCVTAFLAACAATLVAPRDPKPFDVLGRVSATYSGGNVTANVRWEHGSDREEIWLMTPTGQTLAHILEMPTGVILTRADQQQHRARSIEGLTRQALGWPLPVNFLQHWVRGVPAPGTAVTEVQRDANGRLTSFTQGEWRVALAHHEDGEYAGRVRRVDFVDGPNQMRLLIDTWRSPGPT